MLNVANISFQYAPKKEILSNISFNLKEGQHLCVMGESGSGKSTLLKAIYGLLDLKKGSIYWKNQEVLGPAFHLVPGMSFFKYVAQDFDLMPYTSVAENIGKFLSRFYPEEKEQRTKELLEVIEMSNFANEKVKTLSGGQQQRVAIARALAKEPELILLDEPFGQIDNFKKNSLRRKLFSYLKEKNISCIVATHDGDDALSFADQMMVIKNKKVIAFDSPRNLYKSPPEHYVAALFDDVNELYIDGERKLMYPHQIQTSKDSLHRVIVKKSFFKGSFWLIEATFNSQVIFFQSTKHIVSEREVGVSFNNYY
ncbi:ABC transporter ATP-binding protein [Flavobacteriaceae bacterium]|jgi:ABC-type proline/glycine betaine transport system ATPase subunit|nr:ABC transporter ATP-binding protein [Flavobacteriaceae bacterium]